MLALALVITVTLTGLISVFARGTDLFICEVASLVMGAIALGLLLLMLFRCEEEVDRSKGKTFRVIAAILLLVACIL